MTCLLVFLQKQLSVLFNFSTISTTCVWDMIYLPCPKLIFILVFLVAWYRFATYLDYSASWHYILRGRHGLYTLYAGVLSVAAVCFKSAVVVVPVISTVIKSVITSLDGELELLGLLVSFIFFMYLLKSHKWRLEPENLVTLLMLKEGSYANLLCCINSTHGITSLDGVYFSIILHVMCILLEFASWELLPIKGHSIYAYLGFEALDSEAWWLWGNSEPEKPKARNYWDGYEGIVEPSDIFIQLGLILFLCGNTLNNCTNYWYNHHSTFKTNCGNT